MKQWETLVDRKVREVIGDGDISHLPGAGEPLNLEDDPNTPDHLRVAYKIMRDNDVVPDWIARSNDIDQTDDKLRKQIAIRADRFNREHTQSMRRGKILELNKIEADWQTYIDDFKQRIDRHNRRVLEYNISVPKGVQHKQILSADKLIAKALKGET